MAEKRDAIVENAFAETVGGPPNPLAGPIAFASFSYQMARSSIVFWSELTESMMQANAAMMRQAAVRTKAEPETSSAQDPAKPEAAPPEPVRQARPAKSSKLRVVASSAPPIAAPEARDDLKLISGIGPKLEKVLNGMGISTFIQLATLDAKTISEIESKLGFNGRIGRDDWVGQAEVLAGGSRTTPR